MIVKALSIHQPWASLIAMGLKHFETRSWTTNYRGPLLICASKHKLSFGQRHDIVRCKDIPTEYRKYFYEPSGFGRDGLYAGLPFGKALCLVDLADCQLTGIVLPEVSFRLETKFGDFFPGRFAWRLKNVRTFEPFAVRGQRGLFEVEVPDRLLGAA